MVNSSMLTELQDKDDSFLWPVMQMDRKGTGCSSSCSIFKSLCKKKKENSSDLTGENKVIRWYSRNVVLLGQTNQS